jgi:hypothetical protein
MSYASIPLSAAVSEGVRNLISDRVEPILRDVKKMLESTQSLDDPGFNLTAVPALCAVVGGLSRVFYRTIRTDSEAFPKAASRYPLSDEPLDGIRDPERFASELYKAYRCSLVHSLGLNVKWSDKDNRWEILELSGQRKVTRAAIPLSEAQSIALDDLTSRPAWLPATLSDQDAVMRLNADALYWGVRRLVNTLADEASLREAAEDFARPWRGQPRTLTAHRFAATSTAISEGVTFSPGSTAIRATMGGLSGSLSASEVLAGVEDEDLKELQKLLTP